MLFHQSFRPLRRAVPSLFSRCGTSRGLCSSTPASTPPIAPETPAQVGESPSPEDVPYDPAKPGRPIVRLVDFSRFDVRVGRVTFANVHPENPDWYMEGIDLGEKSDRSVVSGLTKFYTEEELMGRLVICLCNLKPGRFRSVESTAMLLCAERDGVVETLAPPKDSQPGDPVFVDGCTHEELGPPDFVIFPRKPMFAKIMADLKVRKDGIAAFRGIPLQTSKGEVKALRLRDCPIS